MAKRKQIDNKDLLKMIEEGSLQSEIMEKFGFKNSTQLKVAYANALMESGGAPKIKRNGRTKKVKPVNTKVTVNGRGSLIIPKALVDTMKIKAGHRHLMLKRWLQEFSSKKLQKKGKTSIVVISEG
jgi:hypothetical protein